MVERRRNDAGQVAVLIAPGYGAGWYTWHYEGDLLWDAQVVDMVLAGASAEDIVAYCEKTYGDDHYYGGADDLVVVWVDPGREFRIDEYDGAETLVYRDQYSWMVV